MPDLTSQYDGWREHLEVDEVFSSEDFAGRGQAAYFVVETVEKLPLNIKN